MSRRQQRVRVTERVSPRSAFKDMAGVQASGARVGQARAVNLVGKGDVTGNPRTVPSQGNAISPRDEEGRHGALGK